MSATPRVSVVVPSYEGAARVRRLLSNLAQQTAVGTFEVVVVDDGSPTVLAEQVDPSAYPFALKLVRQANAGAASARHRGATQAKGELLLFVDDDMEVPDTFVAAHAERHAGGEQVVVLGRMRGHEGKCGLMERWHQFHLDRYAQKYATGKLPIRGNALFSGNVSMRRADYVAAGGFDASLRRGHDAELGLRLEKLGVRFTFAEEAWSRHAPEDHALAWWRDRAMLYGRVDLRIARKHPDAAHASPWRWLRQMNPASRPFIHLALKAPSVARVVGGAVLDAAHALDAAGLNAVAIKAVSLAYTMDYFRGVHEESARAGEAAKGSAPIVAAQTA